MFHSYSDKNILVIGGASGIGREIVNQLAAQHANVIIADRNSTSGLQLAESLTTQGYSVSFIPIELTDTIALKKLFSETNRRLGSIDYMFNSGGVFMGGEIGDTPLDRWQAIVEANITTAFNITQGAYSLMKQQGYGHIINFGSAAGLFPVPAMGIYGATKYAVVGLSHGLRNEAALYGVNVSVACPITVNTPLYDTALYNRVDSKKALRYRGLLQSPETAARKIIRGTRWNRATIHTSALGWLIWVSYRLAPWLYNYFARRSARLYQKTLRQPHVSD